MPTRNSLRHAPALVLFVLTVACLACDRTEPDRSEPSIIKPAATNSATTTPVAAPPIATPAPATTVPSVPTVPVAPAATGPIRADPPGVDFGVVEPGAKVSATIKLLNPLDVPVKIKLAKPSCTCTTVDVTGKTIPARGFIEMPMALKTSNSVGKRSATIDLVFEGVAQLLSVRIDAETAYAVRANPPFIDALAAERMSGSFELVASDGVAFRVLTVDGRAAQNLDNSPMVSAARQVVRYDFNATPTRPVPPFVIVETDHPKCPLLDLRVRHETTKIAPALSFSEFRGNMGVLAAKGSSDYELLIKHAGAARISLVSSLNPAARTELLEQTADGDSLLVRFRLTDVSLPQGMFLFPCRFTSGQKSADFWLYGSVR